MENLVFVAYRLGSTVWTFIKIYVYTYCFFRILHKLNPNPFSYKTTFIKNASKVLFQDVTLPIFLKLNQLRKQKGKNFFFTLTRNVLSSTSIVYRIWKISYSVSHNFIYPSKKLCSKMDLGEVGVSLPWWCHALVLIAPGY